MSSAPSGRWVLAAALFLASVTFGAVTDTTRFVPVLSAADARAIAASAVQKAKVDLTQFEVPTVSHSGGTRDGVWTFFYVARSHRVDACFSVRVRDIDGAAVLEWCS